MPDDASFAKAHYDEMSPTLLSKQPLSAPNNPYKDKLKWTALYQSVSTSLEAARAWRWSWWSAWAVLAEYLLPRRYVWVVTANRQNKGQPINQAIIDTTGAQAVRTCAAGLWSGLTSPSRPWFELEVVQIEGAELDGESQNWLESLQRIVYAVLEQSNFYDIMAQAFQDVVVFGTAPVIVYPDDLDVVRFYLPCAGEYFLTVGARLTNDGIYREFQFTVQQIVEQFGLEACPTDVQMLWTNDRGGRQKEFVVCHAIEPNTALPGPNLNDRIDVLPGVFTYREVYWIRGSMAERPLSLKGFRDKPFMTARWATTSNDPYGRSLGMDVLGDNKQVQRETLRKAEFLEKGVRPPMGANPELKNEPSSITPGNITYTSTDGGKKGFWPLFEVNPVWLQGITADIDVVNRRIKDGFYVNLFMAITQMQGVQPRNELELTKRDLERLQELGPFITRFEREFAGPAIQSVTNHVLQKRMVGPMPEKLRTTPIRIAYKSIMRMAQEAAEALAMKDFFITAGQLSAASKAAQAPDPLRTVRLDLALKRYGKLVNFSSDLFFTDDEVHEHDAIRMEEKQKEQMNVQGPEMLNAGVNAAKVLSETQMPGADSALASLLG